MPLPMSEYEPAEYELHVERNSGQFGDGLMTRVARVSIPDWSKRVFFPPKSADSLRHPSVPLFNW
jgi:hypothetical protein